MTETLKDTGLKTLIAVPIGWIVKGVLDKSVKMPADEAIICGVLASVAIFFFLIYLRRDHDKMVTAEMIKSKIKTIPTHEDDEDAWNNWLDQIEVFLRPLSLKRNATLLRETIDKTHDPENRMQVAKELLRATVREYIQRPSSG